MPVSGAVRAQSYNFVQNQIASLVALALAIDRENYPRYHQAE